LLLHHTHYVNCSDLLLYIYPFFWSILLARKLDCSSFAFKKKIINFQITTSKLPRLLFNSFIPTDALHLSGYSSARHQEHKTLHTWFVPKVIVVFYLNVYWTHLKLQVISFKLWPLWCYTVVPTFFPLITAALEVIFHKCV
jgi:hypothetical protein